MDTLLGECLYTIQQVHEEENAAFASELRNGSDAVEEILGDCRSAQRRICNTNKRLVLAHIKWTVLNKMAADVWREIEQMMDVQNSNARDIESLFNERLSIPREEFFGLRNACFSGFDAQLQARYNLTQHFPRVELLDPELPLVQPEQPPPPPRQRRPRAAPKQGQRTRAQGNRRRQRENDEDIQQEDTTQPFRDFELVSDNDV